MSNAKNLRNSVPRMLGMDVDKGVDLGNGLCDHDHPIPRKLNMRSRASRRTFWMDSGRSIIAPCWSCTGGSYLLRGSLATVQARDLNTIMNNQP